MASLESSLLGTYLTETTKHAVCRHPLIPQSTNGCLLPSTTQFLQQPQSCLRWLLVQ